MAEYRCDACRGLVVQKPDSRDSRPESPWYPHHRNLFELKSCAESRRDKCSVCQLLWTAIKRRRSTEDIQYYLGRRSANVESVKTRAYNPQLFLTIDLGEDPPDSPPDDPLGSPRDHRIPDNTQCIRIFVNRVSSSWPYPILGVVNISVPSSKSKKVHPR